MIPGKWRKLAALANDPRAPEGERTVAARKLAEAVAAQRHEEAPQSRPPEPPEPKPQNNPFRPTRQSWGLSDAWPSGDECYRHLHGYVAAHPAVLESMRERAYVEAIAPSLVYITKGASKRLLEIAHVCVQHDLHNNSTEWDWR